MTKDRDRETPVVKTVASRGKGIDELLEFIFMHREYLSKKGKLESKRRENLLKQINELVNDRLEHKFWTAEKKSLLDDKIAGISGREITPYDFVDGLFNG